MRRLALLALLPLALTPTAACSSSSDAAAYTDDMDSSPNDTGAGDVAHETLADGAACETAVEGQPCTPGVAACNQGPNPCCDGLWLCNSTTHQWQQAGLGCACVQADTGLPDTAADAPKDAPADVAADAGPFACGSQTCSASQLCTARPPGIPTDASPTPISYACQAIPAACASTPTCACVTAHMDASCSVTSCSVDAAGRLTVGCLGV
jgi:hypothetical protein